jgi:hypothetical protein
VMYVITCTSAKRQWYLIYLTKYCFSFLMQLLEDAKQAFPGRYQLGIWILSPGNPREIHRKGWIFWIMHQVSFDSNLCSLGEFRASWMGVLQGFHLFDSFWEHSPWKQNKWTSMNCKFRFWPTIQSNLKAVKWVGQGIGHVAFGSRWRDGHWLDSPTRSSRIARMCWGDTRGWAWRCSKTTTSSEPRLGRCWVSRRGRC